MIVTVLQNLSKTSMTKELLFSGKDMDIAARGKK